MPFIPFYDTRCEAVCKKTALADGSRSNQKGHFESILNLGEEHLAEVRQIQGKRSVGGAEWQLYSEPDRANYLEEKHELMFKTNLLLPLLAKKTQNPAVEEDVTEVKVAITQ